MMRMRLMIGGRLAGVLVALWLSFSAPVWAQTASTGALTGTIIDNAGAVVPGVRVMMTNEATGEARSVISQSNGSYVVPLLPPGTYRVEFSKTGFKASVKPGLEINVTETLRFDVSVELGAVQEQVTITSEASLLQTE